MDHAGVRQASSPANAMTEHAARGVTTFALPLVREGRGSVSGQMPAQCAPPLPHPPGGVTPPPRHGVGNLCHSVPLSAFQSNTATSHWFLHSLLSLINVPAPRPRRGGSPA